MWNLQDQGSQNLRLQGVKERHMLQLQRGRAHQNQLPRAYKEARRGQENKRMNLQDERPGNGAV